MTIEQHLNRMLGDLMMTVAQLSAEKDALTDKLKAAEAALPPPPTGAA